MNLCGISWSVPVAEIELTDADIQLLCKCSAAHYDGRCRDASTPGPRAFLNGWRNKIAYEKGHGHSTLKERVTFDDLDTSAKILEMPYSINESPEVNEHRMKLAKSISDTLRAINEFVVAHRK